MNSRLCISDSDSTSALESVTTRCVASVSSTQRHKRRERERARGVAATVGSCSRSVRRSASPDLPSDRLPQPRALDHSPVRHPTDLLSVWYTGRSQMPGCLSCPSHATWLRDPELLPGHLTKTLSAIIKVLTDESVRPTRASPP